MKSKLLILSLLVICCFTSYAEARTHFSLNIGGLFAPQPAPVRVVEHHYATYPAPVYMAPHPYYPPVVYVAPRAYVREVYVRPQPRIYSGVSFSWFR